ncbi:hypothetical protein GCM10029978_095340 [Actinoallomurus acanthiterrae]
MARSIVEIGHEEGSRVNAKTVMIFGYGMLGGRVIDEVVRAHPDLRVIAVGRRADLLEQRINLARYAALNYDAMAEVVPLCLDILDLPRVAGAVRTHQPDLIFNATSMLPWWMLDRLPTDLRSQIKQAGSGIWAATDLLLPLRLSQALRISSFAGTFINASFPDLVNPIIFRQRIGPICGIGNVANAVPGVRLAAATMLGEPVQDVRIRLVAHHFTSYNMPVSGTSAGVPFALQILLRGQDVSHRLNAEAIFAAVAGKFRRVKGAAGQAVTVSSAMSVLNALLDGSPHYTHAPGVLGLPGGYPVRVEAGRASLDLPTGLSPDGAVEINIQAGRWDGIRSISATDGVNVTEEAHAIAKRLLDYDADGITVHNCEEKAFELIEKFERWAND